MICVLQMCISGVQRFYVVDLKRRFKRLGFQRLAIFRPRLSQACTHATLRRPAAASDPWTVWRDRTGRYRPRLCRRIRQQLDPQRRRVSRKRGDQTEVSSAQIVAIHLVRDIPGKYRRLIPTPREPRPPFHQWKLLLAVLDGRYYRRDPAHAGRRDPASNRAPRANGPLPGPHGSLILAMHVSGIPVHSLSASKWLLIEQCPPFVPPVT